MEAWKCQTVGPGQWIKRFIILSCVLYYIKFPIIKLVFKQKKIYKK